MKRINLSSVISRRALTLFDFCDFYSIGRSTAYTMIKTGKLRSIRVGGRRLIPVDAAEALLKSEEVCWSNARHAEPGERGGANRVRGCCLLVV
jgi:excisionase family DNA binding protein